MSDLKKIRSSKTWRSNFVKLCLQKRSLEKLQKQYEERSKYSNITKTSYKNKNSYDPVLNTIVENVKNQGMLYYDGPRTLGYGGYVSSKDYWSDITKFIDKFKLSSSNSVIDIGCARDTS